MALTNRFDSPNQVIGYREHHPRCMIYGNIAPFLLVYGHSGDITELSSIKGGVLFLSREEFCSIASALQSDVGGDSEVLICVLNSYPR